MVRFFTLNNFTASGMSASCWLIHSVLFNSFYQTTFHPIFSDFCQRFSATAWRKFVLSLSKNGPESFFIQGKMRNSFYYLYFKTIPRINFFLGVAFLSEFSNKKATFYRDSSVLTGIRSIVSVYSPKSSYSICVSLIIPLKSSPL